MGERLALESLCDFYLAKPFTAKALLGMVAACLAGEPRVTAPTATTATRGRATARR